MSVGSRSAQVATSVASASVYIPEQFALEPCRISLSRLADTSDDGVATRPENVHPVTDNELSPSDDTSA